MKNSGLLIALGLIGYGLYKFTQTGSSTKGLGSSFVSSGTAKVPSIFGARAPATAPVYGGYSTGGSTAQPPAAGSNILPLIQGGINAAKSLYDFAAGAFRRNPASTAPTSPTTQNDDFSNDISFDAPLDTGFDSIDTSQVGDIA